MSCDLWSCLHNIFGVRQCGHPDTTPPPPTMVYLLFFSSFQVTFSRSMSAQSNERMKYYVTVLSWQHMDSLVTSCRIARNFAGWVLNVMTFLALKNSWQTGNSNGFLQTVFNAPLSFHLIAGFAGNVCFFQV